jgi:hypothetical protein
LLLKEFDRMTGEYGFHVVDASRPVRRVANELRRSISKIIDSETISPVGLKEKEPPKSDAQATAKAPDTPVAKESAKAS